MDSSFFEYRDKTGVESDSETEVIDSSLVVDDSFKAKKKFPIKNQTVFVAESEDSGSGDETEEYDEEEQTLPKSVLRKSNVAEPHIISSSEDDASKRESVLQQSEMETSTNNVVSSSSDEEEASPEILPKRRPPIRKSIQPNKSDTSIIGRKKNKRMILMDSDTENSIVIEHDRHKKLICLKDTPLKIDDGHKAENRKASLDVSTMDQSDSSEDEKELSRERIQRSSSKKSSRKVDKNDYSQDYDLTSDDGESSDDGNDYTDDDNDEGDVPGNDNAEADHNTEHEDGNDTEGSEVNESDEGPDEDQMLMSRATRMSIMGVVPKDDSDDSDFILSDERKETEGSEVNESAEGPDEDQMLMSRATRMSIMGVVPKDDTDESDFILSDEKSRGSSSRNSLSDLPDTGISIHKTPQKSTLSDADTSKITCSPIESPLHDITNEFNNSNILQNNTKEKSLKNKVLRNLTNNDASKKPLVLNYNNDDDVTFVESQPLMTNIVVVEKENVKVVDDDVTIIDTKPEIIALSSDDEEEVKPEKKSPKPKQESTSRRSKGKETTMSQYLVPASYPNQVVYVKKHVRENELSKLQGLKEDLQNIKYLLENMDMDTLPDGGVKLIERLSGLEQQVRMQGDKVANMVVEPDNPTAADMANDGFEGKNEEGLTWDDIQKASNAVQPRMFGKQAMATHMAERNVILERLRDLHESLGSRPPESQQASQPAALRSTLMPHQLHALAWLRWRETQSPCGGILADDMGLGKTITMISLVVDDKNKMDDENDNDDDYVGKSSSKLARGGTLVVCPASLMQQWGAEVRKHCAPHAASVCLHHGAARATHPHRLATYDIVLTTYNILQRDSEKNGVLMKILWRRIILDEAHIVRNHKSATSVAVSALRGRRRWCLTGTPVQNKDLDLFALLKFLRCTPFDELTMWKKWIDNKSLGGQERLSTIMRCVLLRRTKQQLQQKGQLNCLPERSTHMNEVTLSTEEMNVYQKVLVFSKSLFAQFLHQRAEKEDGVSIPLNGKNNTYDKMHKKMVALQGAKPVKSHEILVLLLRLRQVCCHCGLIAAMLDKDADSNDVAEDPAGQDLLAELNKLSLEDSRNRRKSGKQEDDGEEENIQEESTTVTEAIRSVMSPNNPVFQLDRQSSKIRAVMDCLRQNVFANPGHKAVVVSQWTSVLRLVEKELERERVRSVTLSGNVPVPARPPLIQALNDPKSNVTVMLLSLCAGGVGLNLCGANHLLLLDPHWNPQLEEQAQDRIYRVGQTKDVHIYRFMCVDTVEQTIRKLQQAKLELAENVLTGARNNNASKLTIEDLKMLFNMGQQ